MKLTIKIEYNDGSVGEFELSSKNVVAHSVLSDMNEYNQERIETAIQSLVYKGNHFYQSTIVKE